MSSVISSFQSTTTSVALARKSDVFQDLPLLDKSTRLTVMELKNCDKQIVNELVYRWCRILTRSPKIQLDMPSMPSSAIDTQLQDNRTVLIIDLVGAFSPIRLGSILRKDERRLRRISIARGCKINSTYVTISSYLGRQANIPNSLKLVVIYQDEFFILKTLELLKECLHTSKCQILLVVPRLDRRDRDVLNLTSNNQILRCDFCVSRKDMQMVCMQPGSDTESLFNTIYFSRCHPTKFQHERVMGGELREDGLHLRPPALPKAQPPLKSKPELED